MPMTPLTQGFVPTPMSQVDMVYQHLKILSDQARIGVGVRVAFYLNAILSGAVHLYILFILPRFISAYTSACSHARATLTQ